VSALFYHELTIQIPREVWIAIHRNSEPPRLDFPPIRVSRLADVAFKTGIEKHAVDGQTELLDSWLICFQMVSRDGSPSIANCLWGRDSNIL
jgi:predicted transcriptional regulator of viral defense system